MRKDKESVGISIGQRHIAAVMISPGDSNSILDSTLKLSDSDLFNHNDYSTLNCCLRSVLKSVTSWIGHRYVPVRVAIPDPVIFTHLMHFDSFPKGRLRQQHLVTWQMEKTFHMQHDTLSVAFRKHQNNIAGMWVFASAVQKSLLDTVNRALDSVNIEPEAVMMAALYRSTSHEIASTDVTAHIRLDPEYISIVILNSHGMPYYIRSFWRRSNDFESKEELLDLIKDVELTLHAFLVNSPDKQFESFSIDVERDFERDLFKHHFRKQENTHFIDNTPKERYLHSTPKQHDYCFYPAIDAATV
ncbi:MAG: hypothetical protein KZQ92_22695 [Candidatus Thiodiazotropha sp. (ex Lucinoma borealis)]|nr:hypothetical protein [Candidatus Thiodiazotropha sp. (ex Lucinoma borealis)]MCU7866771.1 hypothetical protein [Candidatus Thiodiazotropha sp. (ex Lucinoma borealis)]